MESLSFIVFIILSISIFALHFSFPLSSSSVILLVLPPLGVLLIVTHIDFLCFYMFCSAFFVLTHLRLGFLAFGLTVEYLLCNIVFLSFLLWLDCQSNCAI